MTATQHMAGAIPRDQIRIAHAVHADALRGSLFAFLCEFWQVVCDKPLVPNWHVEYLCSEAMRLVERIECGDPSIDLVVNIPPGTTKSTIFSVMLPAWVWTRKPSLRVITSSWEDDLAMKSARLSRDIIVSKKYRSLFPEVTLRSDMGAVSRYGTTAGGLRIITSTKASPTGEHADLTIIDDPIGKSQAVSEAMRDQAVRHMEALSSRRTDKVVSNMIMVMQRLHPEDPTEWLLSHADRVKHICLPAELSDMVAPPELRDRYVGGLLDPVRLSREALARSRRELGTEGYAGEFDQNPQLAAGLLFPVDELTFANLEDYSHITPLFTFTAIDPADKGGDFFTAPICDVIPWGDSLRVVVKDVIYSNDGLQVCCERAKQVFARNRVELAMIEANGLGISAAILLKDNCGLTDVKAYTQEANKMVRILASYELIRRIFIFDTDHENRPEYNAFIKSLTTLVKDGRNKHDDSADAVSACVEILKAKFGEIMYAA
jgi:predicted phage terminase large subunit-like protein